ncbi:hypothetical protein [Pontibacter sp. G13]|uniref:hypothetical protein n=1 Tax=Pontibacter sp. G13 TaxID=3074898 RepID=UPI0028894A90|nr:hypothetical protein [Pontibacter sp. G13]WNJ21379.1 hypothetical protein RJD25_13000 [Pontibacter sp. G13]
MAKYQVHIDPKIPDSSRIRSHQDFEDLYARYESATRFQFWRKLYREPKYFAVVAALIAVIFLVMESMDEEAQMKAMSYVEPPIASLDVAFEQHMIAGQVNNQIQLNSGYTLVIPANAFWDFVWEKEPDSVRIATRLIKNASDAWNAGIPLNEWSGDTLKGWKATAMLEVHAYSDDREVFLKDDAKLIWSWESRVSLQGWKVSQLDSIQRSWVSGGNLRQDTVNSWHEYLASIPTLPAAPERPDILIPKGADAPRINRQESAYEELKRKRVRMLDSLDAKLGFVHAATISKMGIVAVLKQVPVESHLMENEPDWSGEESIKKWQEMTWEDGWANWWWKGDSVSWTAESGEIQQFLGKDGNGQIWRAEYQDSLSGLNWQVVDTLTILP